MLVFEQSGSARAHVGLVLQFCPVAFAKTKARVAEAVVETDT